MPEVVLEEGTLKRCTRCKVERHLFDFPTQDGKIRGYCTPCKNISNNSYYHRNIDRLREEKRIAYQRIWSQKYYCRNKKRILTRVKSNYRKNLVEYNKKRLAHSATPEGRFSSYIYSARYRNLPFTLAFEEFLRYWNKPCWYCGDQINGIGLDRLDSSQGYHRENVASCCASCNRAKLDTSQVEFLSKCFKIVSRHGASIG